MAGKNVHTVPHGDGWANRKEGNQRVSSVHKTEAAAEQAGRKMAKAEHSEHLVHGQNGEIRKRNSYGNDPFPPRG